MTSLCFPPPLSPFVTTQVHKALHFRKAEPTGALLSNMWQHERICEQRSENSFVEKKTDDRSAI